MVRETLSETVERVKGVTGEGSRHDPLVVRLVEGSIDPRMVQTAMNPIDGEIGEGQEERELQDVVPSSRTVFGEIVELRMTPDFCEKERHGAKRHDRHCLVRLQHLEPYLVFQISGVLECVLVENKKVGERGEDEVDKNTKKPES